jgi:hypothetical protein
VWFSEAICEDEEWVGQTPKKRPAESSQSICIVDVSHSLAATYFLLRTTINRRTQPSRMPFNATNITDAHTTGSAGRADSELLSCCCPTYHSIKPSRACINSQPRPRYMYSIGRIFSWNSLGICASLTPYEFCRNRCHHTHKSCSHSATCEREKE